MEKKSKKQKQKEDLTFKSLYKDHVDLYNLNENLNVMLKGLSNRNYKDVYEATKVFKAIYEGISKKK
jgi:hypothetical protein